MGLNKIELLILKLLINGGEMYGLDLIKQSKGRLKRGPIYVALSVMQEKGLVESRAPDRPPEEGHLPRPLYYATCSGARVAS